LPGTSIRAQSQIIPAELYTARYAGQPQESLTNFFLNLKSSLASTCSLFFVTTSVVLDNSMSPMTPHAHISIIISRMEVEMVVIQHIAQEVEHVLLLYSRRMTGHLAVHTWKDAREIEEPLVVLDSFSSVCLIRVPGKIKNPLNKWVVCTEFKGKQLHRIIVGVCVSVLLSMATFWQVSASFILVHRCKLRISGNNIRVT
jgi:hypothetical protein